MKKNFAARNKNVILSAVFLRFWNKITCIFMLGRSYLIDIFIWQRDATAFLGHVLLFFNYLASKDCRVRLANHKNDISWFYEDETRGKPDREVAVSFLSTLACRTVKIGAGVRWLIHLTFLCSIFSFFLNIHSRTWTYGKLYTFSRIEVTHTDFYTIRDTFANAWCTNKQKIGPGIRKVHTGCPKSHSG